MSRAYYNDSEPYVCDWLRNLIAAGHLPDGEVDSRPIQEVTPDDVRAFTQCHFFAGIGGWAYALRLADWPDDRPVWTGSCPCQPFSAAGKRGGTGDVRHLWPAWADLIRECRPPSVFGEQVASSDGVAWFDAVSGDLEGMGYAVGAADLSAAGVGAPHLRQRLWFVADTYGTGHGPTERHQGVPESDGQGERVSVGDCEPSKLGDAPKSGRKGGKSKLLPARQTEGRLPTRPGHARLVADSMPAGRAEGWAEPGGGSSAGRSVPGELADPDGGESGDGGVQRGGKHGQQPQDSRAGFWDAAEWLPCTDGKARPVEPGTFPLAHGIPARVGRLRAYGNAIVPEVAAEFVTAYLEAVA